MLAIVAANFHLATFVRVFRVRPERSCELNPWNVYISPPRACLQNLQETAPRTRTQTSDETVWRRNISGTSGKWNMSQTHEGRKKEGREKSERKSPLLRGHVEYSYSSACADKFYYSRNISIIIMKITIWIIGRVVKAIISIIVNNEISFYKIDLRLL